MIAVNGRVLVHSHREDSPWHEAAYAHILRLDEGRAPWAIPWPCIHEFLAIVPRTRIYAPPTTPGMVIDQVEAWIESPPSSPTGPIAMLASSPSLKSLG